MPAILRIDQAGLALGTAGKTRSDGLLNGALVTLTSTGAGTTHVLQILWVPDGDTDALVSFVQLTGTTWSFTPSADAPGTYRLFLDVDGDQEVRELRVRTANLRLIVPALNELADPFASLIQKTAAEVDASEDNELETVMPPALSGLPQTSTPSPFLAGNYGGWYRWTRDTTIALEDRAAGLEPQGFQANDGLQDPIADQSVVRFDGSNVTLNVLAPSLFFDVFIKGRRVRKESQQLVATPGPGEHWIHFDPDAVGIPLDVTSSPDAAGVAEIMRTKTPVAVLVEDFNDGVFVVLFVDKRHDLGIGPSTKALVQSVAGARWVEGVLPNNFVLGDGSLDGHAQFSIGDGFCMSLDMLFAIENATPAAEPQALAPVLDLTRWLFRLGSGRWRRVSGDSSFPINASGGGAAHNATGTSLVLLADGEFALATYFGVKALPRQAGVSDREGDRVVAIVGQAVFTDLADAQAAADRVLADLDRAGLPADLAAICTVIIEANSSFLNGAGSRVRPTSSGAAFIDHRALLGDEAGISGPGGGGGGSFRNESTGVFAGGLITAGVGVGEVTISDGSGQIVDFSDPTAIVAPALASWSSIADVAITAIATTQVTFLFINSGGVLVQVTQPVEADYRDKVYLGYVLHGDNVNVDDIVSIPKLGYGGAQNTSQLLRAFDPFEIAGLEISGVAATLTMRREAGIIYAEGANFHVDPNDSSAVAIALANPLTFFRVFSDGTEDGETNFDTDGTNTLVDPVNFDNAGAKTAIGGSDKQSTLQRLYLAPNGEEFLAFGQEKFADFATAVAAAGKEVFVESSLMLVSRLVGRWALRRIVTDLTNTDAALFLPEQGGGGGGGVIAGALGNHQFFADQLTTPSNADWVVNAKASLIADPSNAAFNVRMFDSVAEEGVGYLLKVPSTASQMTLDYCARARSTPGGAGQIAKWNLYFRAIPDGAAVGAWSAAVQLVSTIFGADQFFQVIEDEKDLATWGLTAGVIYQFEFTRDALDGGDTLNGIDAALKLIQVRFQ